MASGVKLTGDLGTFKNVKLTTRQRLKTGGLQLCDQIRERTRNGTSADGVRFIRYSEAYAKRKGVGTNDVDLTVSGELLDQLTVTEVDPNSIVLGWRSDNLAERASMLEDHPTSPRPFLDIDDDQLDELVAWVDDGIEFGN
jgi:hypothetical protein